ncbi:lysosome membrane protein 2-like [Physella acuta]|uniref:lysosome membrane protein 2-like n=1 Tax=Physella acuta TaxID=109671 RepID=UPI0027DB34CD|nr:lysosome membrane protein 2-like [Physella acuta]
MSKLSLKKLGIILAVGVLVAAIGGAMFPLLDYIIREEIKKKVVISNTSETYDIWQDIPIPVYMQFYIFDVVNVLEVKAGERPYVNQRGPYTYLERRTKFDIVWNDNGTVTYKQNRTFHFVPEKSVGGESDLITTVNPLIGVLAQNLRWMPNFIKEAISVVLEVLPNEDLFMTRTVYETLWGYEDPALVMLKSILPSWFQTTQIGYFIRKNDTDDGVYTVLTGEKDTDSVGVITKYNGESHVSVWTTEWANMINGSDGTLTPPFGFDRDDAKIFVSDICRSIRGVYKEDVSIPQGIDLRRFGGDQNDMMNSSVNPDNIGFCTPQTNCLPTGLLNSTTCQEPVDSFPLPIIFSFPHFLYADPEVINHVGGLHPQEWEHQTIIDIEPWTGLVLRVSKRLQINIFLEKIPDIAQTFNIRKLYFPVLWVNESSVTDDKHADMLKDQLFTPIKIAFIVKIALICLGGVMVLASLATIIYRKCKINARSFDVPHQHREVPQASRNVSAVYNDTSSLLSHGEVTGRYSTLAPDQVDDKTPLLAGSS